MLSVQRRGIGVILTWSFIAVSVLYVVYTVGRSVLIGIFNIIFTVVQALSP